MSRPPPRPSASRAPVWKPPLWVLMVDALGMIALAVGLMMQFAPESAPAQALPAALRLPLLVFGGVTFLLAWYAMLRMILSARDRR